MNKEFIPFEQSLALKELGFDEPCLAFYYNNSTNQLSEPLSTWVIVEDYRNGLQVSHVKCTAPLFQQSFDWFEKNHSIFVQRMIDTNVNEIMDITYTIKSWKFPPIEIKFENPYDCFDKNKSELICIDKIIEIIKNNQ
jgi:hypothetical protein